MKETTEIRRKVKRYELLLKKDVEEAKQNCDIYLEDIESLKRDINIEIYYMFRIIDNCCERRKKVFFDTSRNVFNESVKSIKLKKVNFEIKRARDKVFKLTSLKSRVESMENKFNNLKK